MVKGDLNISWLSVDKSKMEGTFVSFPERDEIDLTMNEQLVVEYYSCLLYTSPSPRDRTRSRMPSSA